jgi:hypothetical protein
MLTNMETVLHPCHHLTQRMGLLEGSLHASVSTKCYEDVRIGRDSGGVNR